MPTIAIKDISGTDINYVRDGFTMEDAVNQRGRVRFQTIGSTPAVSWGQDVIVYDNDQLALELVGGGNLETVEGEDNIELVAFGKLWGGTVESISETDITVGTATEILFSYDVVDYSHLASRIIHVNSYTSTTAGAIVSDLADNTLFTSDIACTAGTIESGAPIGAITFNYRTYEDIFDELAEMSGYQWTIDKDRKLQFTPVDYTPAPFLINESNKSYRNITFTETRGPYVNDLYLRAGHRVETTSTVEVQKGDGSKKVFVVGGPIGETPTVEVDTGSGYAEQDVGVNGAGIDADFYFSVGSPVILQDASGSALSASDSIRITYKGRFPIVVRAQNDAAYVERNAAETGSGKYMKIIDASDVETADEAQERAEAILEQFSSSRVTVSYTTDQYGLFAGMAQQITLAAHGIDANFLIERMTMTVKENGEARIQVAGAATQTVAGWSYWKQRARQDRKYTIRENEVVDTLAATGDNLTLSDSATATEFSGAYTVNGTSTYINGFHVG